jgi:ribosomal protein S18 acetylase RimI-like enzyme
MDKSDKDLTYRPVAAEDQAFIARLYVSTREAELAHLDWTEEVRANFCQMQYEAQRTHYETHFPNAVHQIILLGDAPIGRIWVDWRADGARVLDIALSPEWRGRGLGSELMRRLQDEAKARDVVVTLSVEHNNPDAKRFYRALGFGLIREIETHDFMEWPHPNNAD